MKKIICLLLALTCMFTLISCADKDLEAMVEVVNSSKPTRITTLTTYQYGTEIFNGKFQTDIDGDDSVLQYRYQRYALPEDALNEAIKIDGNIATIEGSVYYKDGKYSEDGENWFNEAPDTGALDIRFTLDQDNLGDYTISSDGMTLVATGLSAENVKVLFGVDLNMDETGATVSVKTNGNYLTGVSISYVAAETAAEVIIESSYTYNPVNNDSDSE